MMRNLFFTSLTFFILSYFFGQLITFTFGTNSKSAKTIDTIIGFFLVLTPILGAAWFLMYIWD